MARFEMADLESAVLGQAPATAYSFYQLGIQYSVGSDVATDLVSAHTCSRLPEGTPGSRKTPRR